MAAIAGMVISTILFIPALVGSKSRHSLVPSYLCFSVFMVVYLMVLQALPRLIQKTKGTRFSYLFTALFFVLILALLPFLIVGLSLTVPDR